MNFKHGMTGTPTFISWCVMKSRCLNPNATAYNRYGGRGIRVCKRWLRSFKNFLEDMGERPTGKSLDRRKTTGNYTPKNCRWATPKEQANNRRDWKRYGENNSNMKLSSFDVHVIK